MGVGKVYIAKDKFKELQGNAEGSAKYKTAMKYGGGPFNAINIGSPGTMSIFSNGVFFDIILGKKLYFSVEDINGIDTSGERLIIDMNKNDKRYKVAFDANGEVESNRVYLAICEITGIEQDFSTPRITNTFDLTKRDKQREKERIAQLKRDKVPFCPKCKSTSITFVNKKLSIGRTIAGDVIAGGAGAVLGGVTSKKGKLKCLNCGHDWKI